MSVVISDCHQISTSPSNKSKSKQLYSFSKGHRFEKKKEPYCAKYCYNIPASKNSRTCGFGLGQRTNFARKTHVPPPNSYNLLSVFNKNYQYGKKFTFGISREAYKSVYLKHNPAVDKNIPGPGTYNQVPEDFGRDAKKFSLRPKTSNSSFINSRSSSPGPGSYKLISAISQNGEQFLSNYKSSCASIFHPPQSKRFKPDPSKKTFAPGPGAYQPKNNISPRGEYFISNFKSSMCRTFSNANRQSHTKSQSLKGVGTPGPGSYRVPSEFGYYEAQPKYKKETERMVQSRAASSVGMHRSVNHSLLKEKRNNQVNSSVDFGRKYNYDDIPPIRKSNK